MTQPDRPAWPSSGAFPFMPFPVPGWPAPPTPAPPAPAAGFDLLKNLWSQLPGSTQVPGFLVPTVDLDEIDKRIADLRAAESWIEVNLNMLRATIQGLDVQRHTIAALQSLSTMSTAPATVAPQAFRAPPAEAPPPAPPLAASTEPEPPAPNGEATAAAPLAGMAASNWLDYLQTQFTKVAQAALAVAPTAPRPAAQAPKPTATRRPAAKRKTVAKRRRSAAPPA